MDNVRKITETLTKDGDKAIERVREVAEEAIDRAQKSAVDAWADAEKLVQKHPGKAVGLALLAGIALGSLLVALRSSKYTERKLV